MSDTCKHPDTWFSRTVCPEPCGYMHTYCTECSEPLDPCANRGAPTPVTSTEGGVPPDHAWWSEQLCSVLTSTGSGRWRDETGYLWGELPGDARRLITARPVSTPVTSTEGQAGSGPVARALRDIVSEVERILPADHTRSSHWSGLISRAHEALATQPSVPEPRPHLIRRIYGKGKDERYGPYEPCPTCKPSAPEPSTAQVLAGLREEMREAIHDAIDCRPDDLGRGEDDEYADVLTDRVFQAAQQRLAERGQGGGSDG